VSEQPNDSKQPVPRRTLSATIVLVAVNVVAFLFQRYVLSDAFARHYLQLSLGGFEQGFFWQLLSYQLLHGGWLHLLLNCWTLFVFGHGVEWAVGKFRFVLLYFVSGIIGGLFQVMAAFLWPYYFGAATVGASAGVMGVMAAFAMLYPDQKLILLLFFVIPMKIRAESLLGIILMLTGLGIAFHHSRFTLLLGGNVAHFAHLGGILAGLAISRFYFLRHFQPPPAEDEPVSDLPK
jgi:membrane associated rhomboid family serine protease